MKPAKASDDTIVQEIKIRATAEKIFEVLTNPKELLRWWRAEGKFHATHVECDVRPGGKWKMRVAGSGGGESIVSGEYRVIERPRVLAFTWIREEEDSPETLVCWDLEENGGETTVRVTHAGLTSERLRTRNNGWPLVVGLLRDYVEEGK